MTPSPLSVAASAAWPMAAAMARASAAANAFGLDLDTEADFDLETTDAQHCAVGARRDGFGERVWQMPLSSLEQARLQIGRRRVVAGGQTP